MLGKGREGKGREGKKGGEGERGLKEERRKGKEVRVERERLIHHYAMYVLWSVSSIPQQRNDS